MELFTIIYDIIFIHLRKSTLSGYSGSKDNSNKMLPQVFLSSGSCSALRKSGCAGLAGPNSHHLRIIPPGCARKSVIGKKILPIDVTTMAGTADRFDVGPGTVSVTSLDASELTIGSGEVARHTHECRDR